MDVAVGLYGVVLDRPAPLGLKRATWLGGRGLLGIKGGGGGVQGSWAGQWEHLICDAWALEIPVAPTWHSEAGMALYESPELSLWGTSPPVTEGSCLWNSMWLWAIH